MNLLTVSLASFGSRFLVNFSSSVCMFKSFKFYTKVTSKFFNEMVFELDGTFLSFGDMMMTNKGKEPSVMLALSILVRKFPSPGLEF